MLSVLIVFQLLVIVRKFYSCFPHVQTQHRNLCGSEISFITERDGGWIQYNDMIYANRYIQTSTITITHIQTEVKEEATAKNPVFVGESQGQIKEASDIRDGPSTGKGEDVKKKKKKKTGNSLQQQKQVIQHCKEVSDYLAICKFNRIHAHDLSAILTH